MEGTSQPAISSTPMQLLLVGDNDDFSYLRDLLSRTGDGQLGLHHTHSTEEARLRLSESTISCYASTKRKMGRHCVCCTRCAGTIRPLP
jgi:hypothetical protein